MPAPRHVMMAPPRVAQNVANRGACCNNEWTSSSNPAFKFRLRHVIETETDEIRIAWSNVSIKSSDTNAGNITVSKCSIESASGVLAPVYFNNSRSTSIVAGTALAYSDWISAAKVGKPYFKKGDVIWVSALGTLSSGTTGSYPDMDSNAIYSGELFCHYTSPGDSSDDDIDTPGTKSTPSGAVLDNCTRSAMIVGRVRRGTVSLLQIHDSLGDGYCDFKGDGRSSDVSGTAGGGFLRRLSADAGIPMFNLGRSGITLNAFNTSTAQQTIASSGLFTDVVIQRIVNDIQIDGVTASVGQTRITDAITKLKKYGFRKIYQGKPSVTSGTETTYRNTNTTNQVIGLGMTVSTGARDTINAWMTTGLTRVDGLLPTDALGIWDSANKWVVPGRTWTLAATYSAGATSIQVSGASAPVVGEWLVIGAGSATPDYMLIASVSGASSPWTITPYPRYGPVPGTTAYAAGRVGLSNGKSSGAAIAASAAANDAAAHWGPLNHAVIQNDAGFKRIYRQIAQASHCS